MELFSLCLMLVFCRVFELQAASLRIHPNKSQFFWYERVTFSCEAAGSRTLKRNTSKQICEPCTAWGVPGESSCEIKDAYPSDSGVYWCESESGGPSNTVNVKITADAVILESPALPVTEGDKVTLFCHYREELHHNASNNFSASFYKDGVFIGNKGNVTFLTVSKADEGLYTCEHPTNGASPQSWLAVTSRPAPPLHLSLPMVVGITMLIVVCKLMLIVCVKAYIESTKD